MKKVFIVPQWVGFAFLLIIGGICTSAYFPLNFNGINGILVTRDGNEINFDDSTRYRQGWALYRDTTHKVSNPQLIANGTSDTLDNNADSTITLHLPVGVSGFYDKTTKKLTPIRAGDVYTFGVRFKARNSQNQGFMTVEVVANDFTSPSIAGQTVTFRKGVGVEQSFQFAFVATIRSTPPVAFIRITADDGALEIYDMEYAIVRIMRGN